jgi:fermentation-respiration switch protein FrsA (DUF1100 family)
MRRKLWIGSLSLAGVLCAALGGCAQNMFYYPDAVPYGTPETAGLKFEGVRFASLDGTELAGWMIPAVDPATAAPSMRAAKGTVIHFHGNAQNMSAHWEYAGWLARRGFNVFVFDYRGYGQSQGSPGPKGLYEDSVAAIRYVRSRSDVDAARLLVFGQSLGGTQAIAAVGGGERAGVRAVAIESTFFSYSAIAGEKVSGTGFLMNDTYSAERYIAKLAPLPLLLIHGSADEVIPASHSDRLYALAGEPKTLVKVPGGRHIESMSPAFGNTYRDRLVAFFEAALGSAPRLSGL